MLIAALFTIAKIWKQPKYTATDEWKTDAAFIYNGIVFRHKKGQNNAIGSNMGERKVYHTRWSQRQILYDITYMWNLSYDTNKLIYETETDS